MLQSCSQQTNGIFFKDSFYVWDFFYSANLSVHNFILSLFFYSLKVLLYICNFEMEQLNLVVQDQELKQ